MTARRRPGRPRGTTQDPEQRRHGLLDGAESAIRSHGPLVSMESMAAEAGVSKATLYDSFTGKAGLTEALLDRYGFRLLDDFEETVAATADAESLVRQAIEIFVTHVERDPEIYRFIIRNTDDEKLLGDIASPVSALIRFNLRPQAGGDGTAEAIAHAALGSVFTSTDWWSQSRPVATDQFVELLSGIVIAGLTSAGVALSGVQVERSAIVAAIALARANPYSNRPSE